MSTKDKVRKGSNKDKGEKEIEEIYKKMSQHDHILALPDTYIGSIEADTKKMWIYDEDNNLMVKKDIIYTPGLYKIFDEVLVNARDHTVRDKSCKTIKVNIDKETGEITVFNDGNGIPVAIHKEHKVYVPELIFGNLLTSSNYDVKGKTVGGKNGLGSKCVRFGTIIPLWNGETKKAEDIKVEDKLIGDDGTKRNVKKIITGKGKMYTIEQANSEPYTVNDQHILTLHMPDHKVIFWNSTKNAWSVLWWDNEEQQIKQKYFKAGKPEGEHCEICNINLASHLKRHYKRCHPDQTVPIRARKSPTKEPVESDAIKKAREEIEEFCKTIPDNNVFDISIQDYMKLNDTTKMRLAGVRGQCVQWSKQKVVLDPYVLGLWLGDGYSSGYAYTCYGEKDTEIMDYLYKWAEENNAEIKKTRHCTYSISSKSHKGEKGHTPLKNQLDIYNLVKNKHIPLEYIVNDRETRLKVLAGIIDTDGTVMRDGTRIKIVQSIMHKRIVDDIVLLTRSLGFNCQLTKQKTSWTHKGEKKTGEAYAINISGEGVQDIPTLLPRKKCSAPKVHNTAKSTGFITIKEAKDDDYVGFELDGNHRFVINDFTVTHNCANIFSDYFIIETVDSKEKKYYYQKFENNMYMVNKPFVKDEPKGKPYTKIIFKPDYKKFGLKGMTDDIASLFMKRVYDIAVCTNVKVYLNDKCIEINSFDEYIKMFYKELPSELIYHEFNERWRVCTIYDTNSGFNQISFVNGISTFQGGTHVSYILDQITEGLTKHINAKHKSIVVKPSYIRDNLTLFIDSVIEDPSFTSQTKEYLATKSINFGSTCVIDDEYIKRIIKTGIVDEIVKFAEFKANNELKKSDGKKVVNLRNISKLEDAKWAGTQKSRHCRLIVTEGDSAKVFAVSGLEVIGREKFGVFPLRGKPLNVREAQIKQLRENNEFVQLKQILGLRQGKKYDDLGKLRYGGIIILTDQDVDGSHIKGLLINMFHHFWPSLIKHKGFITTMQTPIIKIFKKNDSKKASPVKTFYTITDYKRWVEEEMNGDTGKYDVKYYKGLGTSTEKEARECFNDFEGKLIRYIWESTNDDKKESEEEKNEEEDEEDTNTKTEEDEEEDDDDINDILSKSYDAITLAFEKKRANDRKEWLGKYNINEIIDIDERDVPYSDFINKELIHFSNYDNIRSIPSMADGLKPSQRKILYACFKKNIEKNEIKVAQLAGYVAEQTEYHHGEQSLMGAIIGLAQNFIGANNLNLITPNGNFGTRKMGGKDAASARYIFTQFNKLTKLIFRKEDEAIYDYYVEDGKTIEPITYAPIIPMVLINGAEGIGTGYSTDIPCYNPKDVAYNILRLLEGQDPIPIHPWFKNYRGTITRLKNEQYQTTGNYEVLDENTIRITELPIRVWTNDYKDKVLDKLVIDDVKTKSKPETKNKTQFLTKYDNASGNDSVNYTLSFYGNTMQKLIKTNTLEKELKLVSTFSINNMHLYNSQGKITKYDTVEDILYEYYDYRLKMYGKRKEYMILELTNDLNIAKYRVKFINEVLDRTIIIERRKKELIIGDLEKKGYPKLSSNARALEEDKTYKYIIDLPLFSLTLEKIDELTEDMKKKQKELDDYTKISLQDLWKRELLEFVSEYDKWILDQEREFIETYGDNKKSDKKKSMKKGKK